MPRKPDERIIQAKELYLKGLKLVEIASVYVALICDVGNGIV